MNAAVTCQRPGASSTLRAATGAIGRTFRGHGAGEPPVALLEENNGGKRCDSQDEHYPFQVIALEPTSEVKDQNDYGQDVKRVEKHVLLSPRGASPNHLRIN